MNQYVTGTMIKRLRTRRGLTQQQLADRMNVSDKAVSKWETGRGYPDIALIEPLASVLGVSVIELFSGENVVNTNRAFNMLRMKLYVCPMCGNVIQSAGEAVVSCCGIILPPLEAEPADSGHAVSVERVEDEYCVTVSHEMSKTHYISFIAAVRDDGWEIRKLYPEGGAEARFRIDRTKSLCYYCNRHGLFEAHTRFIQRPKTGTDSRRRQEP
ncbi:MAG: helix-turn-helix domain-containing protein [Clostridia bacterium]|nr:helix-turn-helix domain-containing protein [Clostridia bacterium]